MIKPKITHKKFYPGKQVPVTKGAMKKLAAFNKPPVAKVGKRKKK